MEFLPNYAVLTKSCCRQRVFQLYSQLNNIFSSTAFSKEQTGCCVWQDLMEENM